MFFLVTGSSGAGKSTARRLVTGELAPETECIELGDVVTMPPWPTIAWRQQAAETVVQRALALQAEGRRLLLAGDPVAAGEVVAAPSAARLEAIGRVCSTSTPRRKQRGSPSAVTTPACSPTVRRSRRGCAATHAMLATCSTS